MTNCPYFNVATSLNAFECRHPPIQLELVAVLASDDLVIMEHGTSVHQPGWVSAPLKFHHALWSDAQPAWGS